MGISDLLGGLSFSDAATAFGQGWLDEDKAIKQAKAKAAQEEKEKEKVWLDAAITSWTNPENSATNKHLMQSGWTADTIMADPKNYLAQFNLLYTPEGEKPNEFDAISKILDNEGIQPILNQIQKEMGEDFEKILSDQNAAQTFIALFGKATSAPEDSIQTVEDFRKLLTSENKETQAAFAKLFGEKIDKTATHPVMSGKTFTAENIATNDQVAMKALNIWNNMVDLDEKESENKLDFWQSTPNTESKTRIQIDGFKAGTREPNQITENDQRLFQWLSTPEGKNYLKPDFFNNLPANERETFQGLLANHFNFWQLQGQFASEKVGGAAETVSPYYGLTFSEAFRALPDAWKDNALNNILDINEKDFSFATGKEVGASGSSVDGTSIVKGVNDGENTIFNKEDLSPTQVSNYGQLATNLNYSSVNQLWNNQPDLLDNAMNPLLDLAAKMSIDPMFNTKVGGTKEQPIIVNTFSKGYMDWSTTEKQNIMAYLKQSGLSVEDQIRTLGILMREDVQKYLPEPILGRSQQITPKILQDALQKRVDDIFKHSKKMYASYQNQVAAGAKLMGLFDSYISLLNETDESGQYKVDVGGPGSLKAFWNNMFTADESVYNRLSGMIGGGKIEDADQFSNDFMGVILAGDNFQNGSLSQISDDTYEYINLNGDKIQVDASVIDRLRNETKSAAKSTSYMYGQKRALELYIAYTMARVFDDNGRISDKDLDLQLQTFKGSWDINREGVEGAINIARNIVENQHAIASNLTGTHDPARGFTRQINTPSGPKTYFTTAPMARVNAANAYLQLSGIGDSGKGMKEYTLHDQFNIEQYTGPYQSYTMISVPNATFNNSDVSRVVIQGSTKDPLSIPIYAIKGSNNKWLKIPHGNNSQVVFAETEPESKNKSGGSIPLGNNIEFKNGQLVYMGDTIQINDNTTINKGDVIGQDQSDTDLMDQINKYFEGVSE